MLACSLSLANYDPGHRALGAKNRGLVQFCDYHTESFVVEFYLAEPRLAARIDWHSWMLAGLVLQRSLAGCGKEKFEQFVKLVKHDIYRTTANSLVESTTVWQFVVLCAEIAREYTKLLDK